MLSSHAYTELTIRRTRSEDDRRLATLAVLDSAPPLHGETLVAEVDGQPVAALELAARRAVADPFRPTAGAVDLLRLRAGQLGGGERRRRARRRGFLRPRRPAAAG